MRFDIGKLLGFGLECIFFIYYADTMFYRKVSKPICYAAIIAGYTVHLAISVFENTLVNTTVFFVINGLALFFLYHTDVKNALFQSALLTVLSTVSEYAITYLCSWGDIMIENPALMSAQQSLFLTFAGKPIYWAGIMIITRLFAEKKGHDDIYSGVLVLIPIITVIIFFMIIETFGSVKIISGIFLLLAAINLIAFRINQVLVLTYAEKEELRQRTKQEKIDFEEYSLLKEKSEQTRIFHHDFKEHMNILNSLISEDNDRAKEYIKTFSDTEYQSQFIEYTDNKLLNIILTKKKEECNEKGIQFIIEPVRACLNFFNDMDTVSIFTNLINNAIESSGRSSGKEILFSAYAVNENFIVIKVENTADKKPLVIDGKLKTHKNNSELHGIGINSIRKALKNYNGTFNWKYDKERKFFCTTITVQQ